MRRRRWLLVFAACSAAPAAGCKDKGAPSPAASASAAASPAPTKHLPVGLKSITAPDGKSAAIHVVIPALNVDESLGVVSGMDTCSLWPVDDVLYASCSPAFQATRLKLTPKGSDLLIEGAAAPRTLRLPPGARVDSGHVSLGVNQHEDAGCPDAGTSGAIRFALDHPVSDPEDGNLLLLVAGTIVPLTEIRGATACTSTAEGDHFNLSCGPQRLCSVTPSGHHVELRCEVPSHTEATLQLPCGTKIDVATGNIAAAR
jgi:hypothetical protein